MAKELNLSPDSWLDHKLRTFNFWQALYYGDVGTGTKYEKLLLKFLEETRKNIPKMWQSLNT